MFPEQHVVLCDNGLTRQACIGALFLRILLLDGIRRLTVYSSSNVNGGTVSLVKLQDDIVTSFGMRTDEGVVLA